MKKIFILFLLCSAFSVSAQDSLAKRSGIAIDLSGWTAIHENDFAEGPVNYYGIGLGYHARNYSVILGYSPGNSIKCETRGFYGYVRYKLGANLIDIEFTQGKGGEATSAPAINGSVTGYVYSNLNALTRMVNAGYWRQIKTSPFYFGGKCMYQSGKRTFESGGTAATSEIDEQVSSTTIMFGTGVSCIYYHSSGFVFASSFLLGGSKSQAQNDYTEIEVSSGNTVRSVHERNKQAIGFCFMVRAAIGFSFVDL